MPEPSFMRTMEYIFSAPWFSVAMTCVALVLLLLLIVFAYISCRQRRVIVNLAKQLEEGGKTAQLTETKQPLDNGNVIVINESPASQVWESDECVFYDLGSVSRRGSCDTALDETTDDEEDAQEHRKEKRDSVEKLTSAQETTKEPVEEDRRSCEETPAKSLEESKVNGGSIEGLTEDIWVGGEDVTTSSRDMISINDALSDISEGGTTAHAEDSGNETTSNEDLLSGDGIPLADEGVVDEEVDSEEDGGRKEIEPCETVERKVERKSSDLGIVA